MYAHKNTFEYVLFVLYNENIHTISMKIKLDLKSMKLKNKNDSDSYM